MYLKLALLLSLSLWQKLVSAGAEVRGIEILLYYTAYRLDVEVSSALAEDEGKDPDKSWKMANKAFNTASDFPGGVIDESKHGANFHAFVSQTAKDGYAKQAGLTKIADPWNPTWQEVRDIVKWEPIPKGSEYSYGGFIEREILGALAEGVPRSVTGPGGKSTKNKWFDFDNLLAVVGKHAADLYDKKPELSRPYMEQISTLAKLSAEGRKKESAEFKITAYKKALAEKNKKFNKGNPNSITGAVQTKKRKSKHFGEYVEISMDDTDTKLKKQGGKNYDAFKVVADELTKAYRAAEKANDMKTIKAVDGLDSSTKDHIRVIRQQIKLGEAIDLHLNGEASGACEYPEPMDG